MQDFLNRVCFLFACCISTYSYVLSVIICIWLRVHLSSWIGAVDVAKAKATLATTTKTGCRGYDLSMATHMGIYLLSVVGVTFCNIHFMLA